MRKNRKFPGSSHKVLQQTLSRSADAPAQLSPRVNVTPKTLGDFEFFMAFR